MLYQFAKDEDGKYGVLKFDDDFNLLAMYKTSGSDCDCPARGHCKHIDMVKAVRRGGIKLKSGQFWDYDRSRDRKSVV